MLGRRKFIKLLLAGIGLFFSSKISSAAPGSPQLNSVVPGKTKKSYAYFFSGADNLVLRVHAPALSPAADSSVYQQKLHKMLEKGLKRKTGQESLRNAWLKILRDYKAGDSIAIKPNFNFIHLDNSNIITSPDLLHVLVRQLIEIVGVSPSNIVLYDLCKKIPSPIKSRIHSQIQYRERFDPESFVDKIKLRLRVDPAAGDLSAPITMRNPIRDELGKPVQCYIPKTLTGVQHLINVPLMTNHIFIANSGALKNHFGTVRFSNYSSYPTSLHGEFLNESIADINLHPAIKEKTKLILADGILGVFDRGEGEGGQKWLTFGNDFPKSIFLSTDPVALDSVLAGHVFRERRARNLAIFSDSYLQTAADSGLGINLLPLEKTHGARQYSTLTI